jgi:hypothetical protein
MNKKAENHMSKKMEKHMKKKKDLIRNIGLFIVGVFMLTSIIGSALSTLITTKTQSPTVSVTQKTNTNATSTTGK